MGYADMLRCCRPFCHVLVLLLYILSPFLPAAKGTDLPPLPILQLSDLLKEDRYAEAVLLFRKFAGNTEEAYPRYLQFGRLCADFKMYRRSLQWINKAILLDPARGEAYPLAVEVCLLDHRVGMALRYAERSRPMTLSSLEISANTKLDKNLIADELGLNPEAIIREKSLRQADWRFSQHDYLDWIEYDLAPDASSSSSRLTVHSVARKGWGDPFTFLLNTFGGVFDHTLRLSYWNWGQRGVSSHASFRWKPDARWAAWDWNLPRLATRSLYAKVGYSWHEDRWLLSPGEDFSHSFYLRRHDLSSSFLFPLKAPLLTFQLGLNYRWRWQGPMAGKEKNAYARQGEGGIREFEHESLSGTESTRQVVWLRFSPAGTLFSGESISGFCWTSAFQLNLQKGYGLAFRRPRFDRYSFSWKNSMEHLTEQERHSSLQIDTHFGSLSRNGFVEDHFLLGTGRYADYLLRAHPLMESGRLGASPLLRQFALGNITVSQDVLSWRNMRLNVAAFGDILGARILYPGQLGPKTYLDTGAAIEIRKHPKSPIRISLVYGHDWRNQDHVFYVTTRFR